MVVNEKILKRLSQIKVDCKKCKGSGYFVIVENNSKTFEDCDCVKKIRKAISYIEANLPPRYLKWDISQLTEDFKDTNPKQVDYLTDYIENIKEKVEAGVSFWLASVPGQAKSSLISYILRKGVDAGISCYFEKAGNLLNKKFDALSDGSVKSFFTHLIDDVELLAIEEIDKIYLKDDMSFNNKAFFDLISDLYDSNKALIISSNEAREDVLKRYPTFIKDRLSAVDYLPLGGFHTGRR
jgi:DNA replication protein DnaC